MWSHPVSACSAAYLDVCLQTCKFVLLPLLEKSQVMQCVSRHRAFNTTEDKAIWGAPTLTSCLWFSKVWSTSSPNTHPAWIRKTASPTRHPSNSSRRVLQTTSQTSPDSSLLYLLSRNLFFSSSSLILEICILIQRLSCGLLSAQLAVVSLPMDLFSSMSHFQKQYRIIIT